MVGAPKHLADLDRIEADVRITCRRCGFEDDWTTAELARHLLAIGGSTVWSEVTRYLTCRRVGCGATELTALPVPYARRQANMPRRVAKLDAQLVETAVAVLEAAARSKVRPIATIDVRLALLVVHAFVREDKTARQFWERASLERPTVNDTLTQPLTRLKLLLVKGGWLAPEVLIERQRTWPWQTPAPRGWLKQPGVEWED